MSIVFSGPHVSSWRYISSGECQSSYRMAGMERGAGLRVAERPNIIFMYPTPSPRDRSSTETFHGPTRVAQTNHKEIACFCLQALRHGVGDFCAISLAFDYQNTPQSQPVTFVTRTVASNIYILLHYAGSLLLSLLATNIMPLLETGRRRTKLDRSYNGPPRQGPVRHISPVQLTLERIHEQNRANVQRIDPARAPAPAPGAAARGKPRLLLMGQRR
jgi:hypothetical protein